MTIGTPAARRIRQVRALTCLTIVAAVLLTLARSAGLLPAFGEARGQDRPTGLVVNAGHPLPAGYSPPELVKLARKGPAAAWCFRRPPWAAFRRFGALRPRGTR